MRLGRQFLPDARSDMLLVLDDTWFVKPSNFTNQWQLDPVKFPNETSGTGADWQTAIARLVSRVQSKGWGGLGVWHHTVQVGSPDGDYAALKEQLSALAAAGLGHIKVDGTDYGGLITRVARNVTGGRIRIEHKRPSGKGPVNGNVTAEGRASDTYLGELADLASLTDVLRTDDIICQLSVPTCLDRFAGILSLAATVQSKATRKGVPGSLGVIAPQDEAYVAAGLSGSMAAMRFPLPELTGDVRQNGNRNLASRVAEITRAARWARIAPPTGAYDPNTRPVLLDPAALTDEKILDRNTTWWSPGWGKLVRQGAPARVTRGLAHLQWSVPTDGLLRGFWQRAILQGRSPWQPLAAHLNHEGGTHETQLFSRARQRKFKAPLRSSAFGAWLLSRRLDASLRKPSQDVACGRRTSHPTQPST